MAEGAATWHPVYVGIGSNLDHPARQVESSIGQLGDIRETRLISSSRLYRSAPLGGVEQPDYVNAVAALLTRLDALSLLDELQAIELARGRERDERRWSPRILDLDLLVFSALKIEQPRLVVPHPGIAERNFVLLPLREVAADLVIPGLGRVASLPVDHGEPRIERIT